MITGLLHAAGAGDKGLMGEVNAARVQWMLSGKASGAWHVHCSLTMTPLEVSVLFSSVGSGLGNVGRGNYAIGNACLDFSRSWATRSRNLVEPCCLASGHWWAALALLAAAFAMVDGALFVDTSEWQASRWINTQNASDLSCRCTEVVYGRADGSRSDLGERCQTLQIHLNLDLAS